MRVAILSPLFESVPPRLYGGTERVVANLCQGLIQSQIEVELFASGDSSISGKVVPVIDQALRLRKTPVSDPAAYHMGMLSMVAKRAGDFDVIHNHHDYWMLPLSEMTETPVLTTTHGRMDLPEFAFAFSGFPKSCFVSISDSQRQPLPNLRWLETIHHGIDLSTFQFYSQPGKYLSFLGRISCEKRPEWAIEIAQRCGVPLKIAAKIEGSVGQSYYDTYVKPHVDGSFIEFVGEISETEKSEFLGNSLAMLFPIDWPEPFGLVVIESLACGTPVLARPCGSMPELLADGVTGFSSMDLKVLSRRVMDIPTIDRQRCRRWVEEKFSLQRMTEDYIRVYRHVASRLKPSHDRWNIVYPVQRIADGNS